MNKIIVLSLVTALVSWSALAVDAPTRIIVNGVVLTMDKNDRRAEAVAIDGDRIVAVGANTEIRKLAGAETDVVDAGGRTVIPGLIDTHLHAIRGGQTYTFETYWYDATTLVAALDALKSAASRKGPGKWVAVAGSWAPEQFAERRAPSVEELNKAIPNNPAYVQYLYDFALLNDKGMEALGLNKEGASFPGIEIERDAQGRATGKVFGNIGSFSGLFARISAAKEGEAKDSLAAYFAILSGRGVTGIVDATGGGSGAAIYDPLFSLWREGRLPLRVGFRISAQTPGNETAWFATTLAYLPPLMGDDRLRFLGLGEILVFKVNDGVRLAPGFKAADDGKDELFKVASLAAQRKYPLEVHAYTDDAAKQILDVFERVSQTHDLRDLRWCIAHISTGTAETFARMKKLGICYSIQMGPYWEAFQIAATNGLSVANYVPPIKLALAAGLMVIGGTDSTRIGEFNTWRAIEYRVTGRPVGRSVQTANDAGVSRLEALRLYTANAAWISFDEAKRGTLEPGKAADLAVLDHSYLDMPAEQIHTIQSVLTMTGGKVVHASDPFSALQTK
jgi:predicted amidohydrolase YtcJ